MKRNIGIITVLLFLFALSDNALSKNSGGTKSSSSGSSRVNVKGYYRSDGTYVKPHTRSCPDGHCSGDNSSSTSTGSGSYLPSSQSYSSSAVAPLKLDWIKCTGNTWCPLNHVDLSNVKSTGVFIIWNSGQNPWTVQIGKGDIASQLTALRNDPNIIPYNQYGLYVTWASVNPSSLNGVERYLAELLKPHISKPLSNTTSIPVNNPF